MDYYNVSDVLEMIGCSRSTGYELIVKLNETLKREYPGTITITGKVPKWYFEEKMKNKRGENKDERNI